MKVELRQTSTRRDWSVYIVTREKSSPSFTPFLIRVLVFTFKVTLFVKFPVYKKSLGKIEDQNHQKKSAMMLTG